METYFEQGPIRPPSEAASLLLRVTRNCPWNRCVFCPVYKGRKFSRRPQEEVLSDLEVFHQAAEELKALSWRLGRSGAIDWVIIRDLIARAELSGAQQAVARWLYQGGRTVFLQDADSLVVPTDALVEILTCLRRLFPDVERVTSYARSRTLAKKSLEELIALRQAGLDRIHVGMESGSDEVLVHMKKGATGDLHIEAGRKVIEAGMELSEYIMPGLGGTAYWQVHAEESSRVLNAIRPHFIRLRTVAVRPGTPLAKMEEQGEFQWPDDEATIVELRRFLENLDEMPAMVKSDHVLNLFENLEGRLDQDKEKMLGILDQFLSLPDKRRHNYILGRRAGIYRYIEDQDVPRRYARAEAALESLEAKTTADLTLTIRGLMKAFI